MFKSITQIIGKKQGHVSIILTGVHGNEQCGVKAFKKIIPYLKIEKGHVFFGYGNPRAIEKNNRFIKTNLNRMFKNNYFLSKNEKKSYEYKRAQFLKIYLNQAGALLDLHASSIPKSKPFIICEANAKKIIKYLPINTVVYGFDKVEPGSTDYYMNKMGKIGICLECGYLKDPKSIRIAKNGIFSFLKARGHITNDIIAQKHSYIKIYKKYFAKTNSFILSKPFDNFETIKKNQLIGIDGKKEIRATKQSLILFAHHGKKADDEVFLLGEKKKALRK